MARKKKRSAKSGRDATHIATLNPPSSVPLAPFKPTPIKSDVRSRQLDSDRRRFNPTKTVAPLSASKRNATALKIKNTFETSRQRYLFARLVMNSPTKAIRRHYGYSTLSERLSFNAPKRIELCLRRAIRGRVLHAKKKTGKTGQKRPVRNFWSAISCKR